MLCECVLRVWRCESDHSFCCWSVKMFGLDFVFFFWEPFSTRPMHHPNIALALCGCFISCSHAHCMIVHRVWVRCEHDGARRGKCENDRSINICNSQTKKLPPSTKKRGKVGHTATKHTTHTCKWPYGVYETPEARARIPRSAARRTLKVKSNTKKTLDSENDSIDFKIWMRLHTTSTSKTPKLGERCGPTDFTHAL